MKKLIISFAIVLLALLVGAIYVVKQPIEADPIVEISDTEPIEDVVNVEIEEPVIIKEYNDFALLDLIPNDENYMVSPLSLKMALLMAANGAEGKTQREILDVYNIEDIEACNQELKALMETYNNKPNVELNLANSIWLNEDFADETVFKKEFVDLISEYYQGVANGVKKDEALHIINSWVEEKTNGKITNLLNSPDFLAVLINTLYFKGSWANEFTEELTETDEFINIDGKSTEKDYMNKTARYNYYEDKTMQMVRIPYRDKDISMYIALPKVNEILDFETALNNMENKKINLTIPKFKIEFRIILNEILKEFGVQKAFSGNAEFDDMFNSKSNQSFCISQVLQKTFIEVDEKGTEAAAATAVIMMNTAFRPQPEEIIDFIANKPFIYFIRDDASGEILFLGKLLY